MARTAKSLSGKAIAETSGHFMKAMQAGRWPLEDRFRVVGVLLIRVLRRLRWAQRCAGLESLLALLQDEFAEELDMVRVKLAWDADPGDDETRH